MISGQLGVYTAQKAHQSRCARPAVDPAFFLGPAAVSALNRTEDTVMEKLVDSAEAARLLALSPRTLEGWRTTGQGPSFRKLGGAVRYALTDLEAFAQDGKRTRTTPTEGSGNGH